jgi:hypothetical protein
VELNEVAPPSKKHERMVKHIKKSYKKDGKLTDDEESIAYATAWKNYNKDKVSEGVIDLVRKYAKKKEEKKPQKAQDAGARARRVLKRREYKSKVSSIVPAELEDHKTWVDFKKHFHI